MRRTRRKNPDQPICRAWTEDELTFALRLRAERKSYAEIAAALTDRTEHGVSRKLQKLLKGSPIIRPELVNPLCAQKARQAAEFPRPTMTEEAFLDRLWADGGHATLLEAEVGRDRFGVLLNGKPIVATRVTFKVAA